MNKNTLILIILIFFKLCVSGQNYYPFPTDSASWTIVYTTYPIFPPVIETMYSYYDLSGDTTFNGKKYSKLYSEDCHHEDAIYVAAVREDSTKQVWVRSANDTIDLLYFDFSLMTGDTFCFPLLQPASGNYCFEVSSVDSILIDGSYRKQIHFEDSGGSEQWIEGIGSTTGWFREWSYYGNYTIELACYSEYERLIYGDSSSCSCLGTGIQSPLPKEAIRIYPNPATSNLIIEIPYLSGKKFIEIYSAIGQKVQSLTMQQDKLSINIENMKGSVIFVYIKSETGLQWIKKIIKNAP